MHVYVLLFKSILCSVTFYDVPLHFNVHAYMYTCFRCARNLYYANRFCRVLPRSKCYSSKTCLMCIICTFEYVRCSNGTMNNTSTLILLYRLLTDLRALMNLYELTIYKVGLLYTVHVRDLPLLVVCGTCTRNGAKKNK